MNESEDWDSGLNTLFCYPHFINYLQTDFLFSSLLAWFLTFG